MEERIPRLKDYVDVILKWKKWIILGTVVPMLAAGILAIFLPNIYEAKAILYIRGPILKTEFQPESIAILQTSQPLSRVSSSLGPSFISQKACELMLKGQDILKDVIERLKLDDVTIEDLDRMLKAERVEETKAYYGARYAPALKLTVTVKGDKAPAARIANTWAELFVERFNMVSREQMTKLYKYILNQFEIAKLDLRAKEEALLRFESLPKGKGEPIKEEVEHLSLKRKVESARDSYNLFRQKLDQVKITIEERSAQVTIVARAVEPQKKIAPKRCLIVFLAGLAGFVISPFFVIAFRTKF